MDICDQISTCSVVGKTLKIGGIGQSNFKYSIIEAAGFNEIQNAAHELGHRYFFKVNFILL